MSFPASEFEARTAKAQALMADRGFDALLLSTEPEVRYFTGYLTRFWESPTRPWFVIVPRAGKPVAVIPAIGAPLMARGWVDDIRTWRSPDLSDDGVSLLIATLQECVGKDGTVAMPMGHETHVRMPLADLDAVRSAVSIVADDGLMRSLRMVKSGAEIDKIRAACAIADRAFARVPDIAQAGVGLDKVFRQFQMLCLEEGADWVPYLAGAAEAGGYADVISPASEVPLAEGDVLMLDTGLVRDGYFCDFDRNFSLGAPSAAVAEAHEMLIRATQAGFVAARPGATAADLFHAMDQVCTGGSGGSDAGRLGHGLGMQLTEWPSLIPEDHTMLEAGMVLTLEPGVDLGGGKIMVHEENIAITEDGAVYLSTPAGVAIPELSL